MDVQVRPTASILYADEEICVVLCPYCKEKHKHGQLWGENDARSSHCRRGEYILGDAIENKVLFQALKNYRYEQLKKTRQYKAQKLVKYVV